MRTLRALLLSPMILAAMSANLFAADGVIIGSPDLGPLAGGGTRAIALANAEGLHGHAEAVRARGIDG